MPRAGRKTTRWALGCGLVVAILAALVWLSWPRERLLLEMAHPVLATDTSKDAPGNPMEQVYWLTSSRLLIITTEHAGSSFTTDWTGHADLFDSRTRTRSRLVDLTNLLNRPGLSHRSYPCAFQVSPSGTHVWWAAFRFQPGPNSWYGQAVATLDGSELREWDRAFRQPTFWTDDQHFVDVTLDQRDQRSQLSINDTRNAHADRNIKSSSAEARSILITYDQDHPLMWFEDFSDRYRPRMTWWWFDVRSGRVVSRNDIVTLPKNTQAVGWRRWIENGTRVHKSRVAFALLRHEPPLLLSWLHRFSPSVPVTPMVTKGLWMSRPGVQNMQEIGHIPVRTDRNNVIEGDQLEQVQILPDGQQVSFIYRNMLYVMPIQTSK